MDEAPADAALFEILKKAHWTALKVDLREKDFGYDFNLMPDTLYMVRMIYFFRPNHDLKQLKYNHLLYYPVLYRNSAWKFDSPEIEQYKFLPCPLPKLCLKVRQPWNRAIQIPQAELKQSALS